MKIQFFDGPFDGREEDLNELPPVYEIPVPAELRHELTAAGELLPRPEFDKALYVLELDFSGKHAPCYRFIPAAR